MAITITVAKRDATSLARRLIVLTLDNSYPTGGWAITPKDVGLGTSGDILGVNVIGAPSGYKFEYDLVNDKLMAFQGDNPNAAAAPGVQLPNASAVLNGAQVVVEVIGHGHG